MRWKAKIFWAAPQGDPEKETTFKATCETHAKTKAEEWAETEKHCTVSKWHFHPHLNVHFALLATPPVDSGFFYVTLTQCKTT